MMEEDIPNLHLKEKYIKECDFCGMSIDVFMQREAFQEFSKEIYIQCQCGNWIEFPVF